MRTFPNNFLSFRSNPQIEEQEVKDKERSGDTIKIQKQVVPHL